VRRGGDRENGSQVCSDCGEKGTKVVFEKKGGSKKNNGKKAHCRVSAKEHQKRIKKGGRDRMGGGG